MYGKERMVSNERGATLCIWKVWLCTVCTVQEKSGILYVGGKLHYKGKTLYV